jgi:hypothetical protein
LLRQVKGALRALSTPIPRIAYDRVLEYGFADQLRKAPSATSDTVADSFQSAYRELQTAGTAQHFTMFHSILQLPG